MFGMEYNERRGSILASAPCAVPPKIENYQLVVVTCRIDDGSFVYLIRHETNGQLRSVRCIPCGRRVTRRMSEGILNQATLIHPHIVRLEEVSIVDGYLCLILDYTPQLNLAQYISVHGPLHEAHARLLFQQFVLAVDYCHKRQVYLREIRLDNLVLGDDFATVRINHFDSSKCGSDKAKPMSLVGKCDYVPPEVLAANGEREYNPVPVDVWAMGVCLYCMVYGYFPFSQYDDPEHGDTRAHRTLHRIQTCELITSKEQLLETRASQYSPTPIDDELLKLLHCLLTKDPEKRISVEGILCHPWVSDVAFSQQYKLFNSGVAATDDKLVLSILSGQPKPILKRILAKASQVILAPFYHRD